MMIPPNTLVKLSSNFPISFDKKISAPIAPEIIIPIVTSSPKTTLSPRAAPPTFPILKANPPSDTRKAMIYPNPGMTRLAKSCPRSPVTPITRQIFSWATNVKIIEIKIAKAKFSLNFSVKTAV